MSITNGISLHHHFEANDSGRDFFVGDIHGQYSILDSILRKVNFKHEKDRIFSVGDLTDRGRESYKCLMLTKEKWFYSVLGNHENFILSIDENDYLQRKIWNKNGGSWWWKLNETDKVTAQKTILENFSLSISVDTEIGRVGLIHAQYPFNSWPLEKHSLDKSSLQKIIWGREDIIGNEAIEIDNIEYVICGHTPLLNPKIIHNKIYIDTGCGYEPSIQIPNPRLTICEFVNGKIIAHCQSKHEYSSYELK